MKATIDLPDDLMVELKVAAARRRCTLREIFETALRRELAPAAKAASKQRLRLTTSPGGLAPGFDASDRAAMYEWIARGKRER